MQSFDLSRYSRERPGSLQRPLHGLTRNENISMRCSYQLHMLPAAPAAGRARPCARAGRAVREGGPGRARGRAGPCARVGRAVREGGPGRARGRAVGLDKVQVGVVGLVGVVGAVGAVGVMVD
jgi:hypothetical protein